MHLYKHFVGKPTGDTRFFRAVTTAYATHYNIVTNGEEQVLVNFLYMLPNCGFRTSVTSMRLKFSKQAPIANKHRYYYNSIYYLKLYKVKADVCRVFGTTVLYTSYSDNLPAYAYLKRSVRACCSLLFSTAVYNIKRLNSVLIILKTTRVFLPDTTEVS